MTRRFFVVAATMAFSACALDKQTAPSLAGPSELALSLSVLATPDIITQDGQSSSVIEVVARDASSQPIRGLTLRAETLVGGVPVDFGVLSSKTVSTGNDGKALLNYRAPAAPPISVTSDSVVTISVTPVSSDYSNAVPRSVLIRLARPGIILPPNGTPVPKLFFSPTAPRENDDVLFDGSQSTDSDGQIVNYAWTFGDGRSVSGSNPRVFHAYSVAATYSVVLTVTDDRGLSASSAPTDVKVGAIADPTALFTFSPTSPKVDGPISFNASGSKASTGHTVVSYDFDFGDTRPHVISGSPFTTHAYDVPATYVVVLKIIDDSGRFATLSQQVTVVP